jgi:hypothetical protein
MWLGFVELNPIHGIGADAGFVGQLPLRQCLLYTQILEPISDVHHGLHCSHLLALWLSSRCAYSSINRNKNEVKKVENGNKNV